MAEREYQRNPTATTGEVGAGTSEKPSANAVDFISLEVGQRQPPRLEFTGERLVPGAVDENLFREHEVRYQFAGFYVKGKDVLDVACGTGMGTDYLRRAGAKTCLGLDVDPGAIEYGQANYGQCRFIRSDAAKMPLPDDCVDVVVSFETIEHLPDPVKFLTECRRVLRSRGVLICSTPNHSVSRWYAKNPFHVRELRTREFIGLLQELFGETKAYTQQDKVYPLFVPKTIILRLLRPVHLDGLLLRLLKRPVLESAKRTAFNSPAGGVTPELRPYERSLIRQPLYVIAVAQKANA